MKNESLNQLLAKVRACRICEEHLPHGLRPVLQISKTASILIAGQAPGRRAHATGVPFNDASGDRLRDWLGVTREQFYDARRIAILPMGFCYPGTGRSGDLPPRPECSAAWRKQLLAQFSDLRLTLVIGQHAIDWHLGGRVKNSLTETVRAWRDYAPEVIPLPHPSPRNNMWLKNNPWFENELLAVLRRQVPRSIPS